VRDSLDEDLLHVVDVRLRFNGVTALDGVTFGLREGSLSALIGPNGAGKTSLFNCISRFYRPDSGSIQLAGVELLKIPAHKIAGIGIARTFQEIALFPSMTVLDNVALGAHASTGKGLLRGALRTPRARRVDAPARAHAHALVDLLELGKHADRPASLLPYGLQKRVEVARALAARPRLLLLDEPASGLAAGEVADFARLLGELRRRLDLTMLLVEHNMTMVMGLSDDVIVMDAGRVIAQGTPAQIQADPAVIETYLGAPV
jgi:branched-chain amino acid transport system ATP-binding protein